MKDTTVDALREVAFRRHAADGVLTVFAGDDPAGVPFTIRRVFTISGVSPGGRRGRHAHRACSQLCVCLTGRVDIRIDDGRNARAITLDSSGLGLLIPPGLWNEVTFAGTDTVLAVFCDEPYSEADYMRDRAEFLR